MNYNKYKEVFINVFDVKDEQLNEGFTFDDIEEWDSVAHLSLISELEDEFDVMFETEHILEFGSFFNGLKILETYGITFDQNE